MYIDMAAIGLACLLMLAGAGTGAFVLAPVADRLLRAKRRGMSRSWALMLAEVEGFTSKHDGRLPGSDEEVAGIWLIEQQKQASRGLLTVEQFAALEGIGVKLEGEPGLADEQEAELFSIPVTTKRRLVSAVAMGLIWGLFWIVPAPDLMRVFWMAFSLLGYLLFTMDARARIIPIELTGAVLLLGAVYQIAIFGPEKTAISFAVAFLVYIVLRVISRFGDSIGGGDVLMLPVIVFSCGPESSIWGAVGFAAALLAACCGGMLARKPVWTVKRPLGPYLCIWLAIGLIMSATAC